MTELVESARTPLPMPNWSRPGETWRVEQEQGWEVGDADGCMARGCYRAAIAVRPRNRYANCAVHLRAGLMWIDGNRVVSWRLRP